MLLRLLAHFHNKYIFCSLLDPIYFYNFGPRSRIGNREKKLISRPAGGQKLYVNSSVNLDKKLYSGKSKVYTFVAYLREIDYPDSFLFHEASSRHTLGTKGVSLARDHAKTDISVKVPLVDRLLRESIREEPLVPKVIYGRNPLS